MIYNIRVLPNNDIKIQVVGSMIAALVGALMGAFVAFGLSEIVRRKQIRLNEVHEVRLRIRASQRAVKDISANVHGSLILILKNLQHYEDLSKGILDDNNMLRATLSLPLEYPDTSTSPADVINIELISLVDSYVNEVILQNINILELNKYYSDLLTTAHAVFLQGRSISPPAVATDNNAIKHGSEALIIASKAFYDKCISLMALMESLAEQYEKIDYTKVTLEYMQGYEFKLNDYKPRKSTVTKKEKELKKKYTTKNALKVA